MKKRIIPAIALVAIIVVSVLLVIAANPEPKYEVDNYGTPVVMTVNGDAVHANEFATYMLSNKANYEQQLAMFGMDASIWSDPESGPMFLESLYTNTVDTVAQYRVIDQKFHELGLKLSREEIKEMTDYRQELVDSMGGDVLFSISLAAQGISEEMFDNSLLISAYVQKINDYYFGDNGIYAPEQSEIEAYFADNYVQAKHILIKTTDDSNAPLPEEEIAAKRQLAEEVLAKVQAGENFDALIDEFNEDPGMISYPQGYVFTEGEMVTEFYEGTLSLGENEVSGLVETDYGYHIIKRLPLDAARIVEYYDIIKSSIAGNDINTLLAEWVEESDIQVFDEEVQKITIDNLVSYANPQNFEDDPENEDDNQGEDTDNEPDDSSDETEE